MRKFYLIHDVLTVNDIPVADCEEFRYIDILKKPDEVDIISTDWTYLFHLALDDNCGKMGLQLVPPSILQACYVKSLDANKRFYKSTFKTLTHQRTVKVVDALYRSNDYLIKTMPKDEFLLLQADMIKYLWTAVMWFKCDPKKLEGWHIAPFEEDLIPIVANGFEEWSRRMKEKYVHDGKFDYDKFRKDVRDGK